MRLLNTLLVFIGGFWATHAYAGAWTQEEGKGQIILNAAYYHTDTLYTTQGKKAAQSTYSKYELNPYIEYGLTEDITIGGNFSLLNARQDVNPPVNSWGVGDSELFTRIRVWQQDGFVVSTEPMVKLPSLQARNSLPKLGGSHPDTGIGVSAGYGFTAFGQNHFVNIDTAYRYRFGHPKDQIRLAATAGIHVTDRWTIMPQLFTIYRTSDPALVGFTQSSGDDYRLLKTQLSFAYQVNDDVSLQLGGFKHIAGQNVGAGDGMLLSVWEKF